MNIEVLILHYIQEKRQKPNHANDLLDYIQNEYVNGSCQSCNIEVSVRTYIFEEPNKRLLDETTPLSLD
ncbi:YppF family protein [Peribacillus frigoritolerans]|nr:YppF family protein [Peribacillus frigoritolerans]